MYVHHYYLPTQGDKRPNQAKLKQAKCTRTEQMTAYLRPIGQYSRMAETELILQTEKVHRVEMNKEMLGGALSKKNDIMLLVPDTDTDIICITDRCCVLFRLSSRGNKADAEGDNNVGRVNIHIIGYITREYRVGNNKLTREMNGYGLNVHQ